MLLSEYLIKFCFLFSNSFVNSLPVILEENTEGSVLDPFNHPSFNPSLTNDINFDLHTTKNLGTDTNLNLQGQGSVSFGIQNTLSNDQFSVIHQDQVPPTSQNKPGITAFDKNNIAEPEDIFFDAEENFDVFFDAPLAPPALDIEKEFDGNVNFQKFAAEKLANGKLKSLTTDQQQNIFYEYEGTKESEINYFHYPGFQDWISKKLGKSDFGTFNSLKLSDKQNYFSHFMEEQYKSSDFQDFLSDNEINGFDSLTQQQQLDQFTDFTIQVVVASAFKDPLFSDFVLKNRDKFNSMNMDQKLHAVSLFFDVKAANEDDLVKSASELGEAIADVITLDPSLKDIFSQKSDSYSKQDLLQDIANQIDSTTGKTFQDAVNGIKNMGDAFFDFLATAADTPPVTKPKFDIKAAWDKLRHLFKSFLDTLKVRLQKLDSFDQKMNSVKLNPAQKAELDHQFLKLLETNTAFRLDYYLISPQDRYTDIYTSYLSSGDISSIQNLDSTGFNQILGAIIQSQSRVNGKYQFLNTMEQKQFSSAFESQLVNHAENYGRAVSGLSNVKAKLLDIITSKGVDVKEEVVIKQLFGSRISDAKATTYGQELIQILTQPDRIAAGIQLGKLTIADKVRDYVAVKMVKSVVGAAPTAARAYWLALAAKYRLKVISSTSEEEKLQNLNSYKQCLDRYQNNYFDFDPIN